MVSYIATIHYTIQDPLAITTSMSCDYRPETVSTDTDIFWHSADNQAPQYTHVYMWL